MTETDVSPLNTWQGKAELFLRIFLLADGLILFILFLNIQFDVFLPAPGSRMNNPFAGFLIALFLLGLVNPRFREKWTERLHASLTQTPTRVWVFAGLVGIEILLLAFSFIFPDNQKWDLNKEQGYGTLFATFQLFFLGVFVLILPGQDKDASPKQVWPWYFVASLYLYLGLDDCIGIHENFIIWFQGMAPDASAFHFIHEWLWVYAPFILIVVVFLAMFFLKKFRKDPGVIALMFLGLTLWVSVIVMEGLAKNIVDPHGFEAGRLLVGIEEGAEMLGATLFLLGFSQYARNSRGRESGGKNLESYC